MLQASRLPLQRVGHHPPMRRKRMEGFTGVFHAACPLGGHGVYGRGEDMITVGHST